MAQQLQPYENGLSGKMADGVYYNRYGKTFLRKAPGSYNKLPTAKQAVARLRFTAAHQFGQSVIADPTLKALYTAKAAGKCSGYSLAVSEKLQQLMADE